MNLLHVHSQYSRYDGYGTNAMMVKRALEIGSTALALTDHGTMSGSVDHYLQCKKHGISPILGIEGYFMPKFDKGTEENRERKKKGEKAVQPKRYHTTLLATSLLGYQNLAKMLTDSTVRGKFFKDPIFDYDTYEQFHEDVILLSGCPAGFIPQMTVNKDPDLDLHVQRLLQIFGENFYFEVMPHDFTFNDEEEHATVTRNINETVVELAQKYGRPTVMTTDSHYQMRSQYINYLAMQQMRMGVPWKNDYSRLYMPTEDEVREWWSDFMDGDPTDSIRQTELIADRCSIDLSFKEMVPAIDWGEPSPEKLQDLAITTMKEKGIWTKPYKQRIKYELDVISTKGYTDYFLLCYNIMQFAAEKGIAVGHGRGSVCGSLLAYCIGLTNVDPLRFDTSFERFLRPDKTTLPDVDMDFCYHRRREVSSYLLREYAGRSGQIATFTKYSTRSLANSLTKLMQVTELDAAMLVQELERLVPNELDDSLDRSRTALWKMLIDSSSRLRELDTKYTTSWLGKSWGIVRHFTGIIFQVRGKGQHPAGVAITSDDIANYIPLMNIKGAGSDVVTAYDMSHIGKLNVVKIDLLGLATATMLQDLETITGEKLSYAMLDDPATYAEFRKRNTAGIFQFESAGAKNVLNAVKPETIEELIACNALNRPGPMQLGVLQDYVDGKNGVVNTTTSWAQYTKDTHGTIVYQEQVMRICREMAGMEWPDVDKVMKSLRQTIGGADPLRDKFVAGAKAVSGISKRDATKLYNSMTSYLFGKGHSTGYTLMSYYMMWMKVHFPAQFYYVIIKHEHDDAKRIRYEAEAVRNGIPIAPPTINSEVGYTLRQDGTDYYIERGLACIAGVAELTATRIVMERSTGGKFRNRDEAIFRLPQRNLNSAVLTALDNVGAFDLGHTARINLTVELSNNLMKMGRWR